MYSKIATGRTSASFPESVFYEDSFGNRSIKVLVNNQYIPGMVGGSYMIMRVSICVHHLSFLEKGSLLSISLRSEEYIIIGGSFYLVPFV